MKKIILKGIVVVTLLLSIGVQTQAATVAAALMADQTTSSSGWDVSEADAMYCENTGVSKYPIKFQARGSSDMDGRYPTINYSITYAVNAKGWRDISTVTPNNCYQIKLIGWNINKEIKGCIGWGKIVD